MSDNNCEVTILPEFRAPQENKERAERGMNSWHGTKFEYPK